MGIKSFLLILLLIPAVIFSQSTPSGWTNPYRFRLYSAGANPGADSLNQNTTDINNTIKSVSDTVDAVKSDFYSQHNYGGTHKSNSVNWLAISGVARAMMVQTGAVSQNIAGTKTITGTLQFSGGTFVLPPSSSSATGSTWFTSDLAFLKTSTSTDTVATQKWVRTNPPSLTNIVTTNTTQEVTGAKTFSNNTTFSSTINLSPSTVALLNGQTTITYGENPTQSCEYLHGAAPDGNTISDIDGGADGMVKIIVGITSYPIVFKDGTGNMNLSGDFTMGNGDVLGLIYVGGSTNKWIELFRKDN